MANPWLKKNPFMSMWLGGANTVANTARGHVTAAARRQTTTAINKAASDMLSLWTGSISTPAPKRKRKR